MFFWVVYSFIRDNVLFLDFIEVNQDSPILNVTECKANDNYNESCLVGKLETDELSQEPIADIPATSSNAELIPETSNIQEPLAPLSQVEATYSTSESSTTSGNFVWLTKFLGIV